MNEEHSSNRLFCLQDSLSISFLWAKICHRYIWSFVFFIDRVILGDCFNFNCMDSYKIFFTIGERPSYVLDKVRRQSHERDCLILLLFVFFSCLCLRKMNYKSWLHNMNTLIELFIDTCALFSYHPYLKLFIFTYL